MTSTPPSEPPRRVAIVGTGLIGTSIAMAAARAGIDVVGWDADAATLTRAAAISGLTRAPDLVAAVTGADLAVVCTPIDAVAATVIAVLSADPDVVVSDAASVKGGIVGAVETGTGPDLHRRFVAGHPMGGTERSGPEHASASVVDGIVWVVTPSGHTDERATSLLEAFITSLGARPERMDPERHDHLVAFVSHLPQVASTSLMGLVATEEADEPQILLLAAGGFRDLTRLAASNAALWREIVLANADQVMGAIDLYVARLLALRDQIGAAEASGVESTFEEAKAARLDLAAKPTVRAGVAVWQVVIPDEPGALARITAVLADGSVNIEDLQIVHSPEGGAGTVHLTVAAVAADGARDVLLAGGYDPIRLA